MRFAPMEMMENRLARVLLALRILGFLPTDLAAHAVEGLLQGSQVVGLGRGDYVGVGGTGAAADSGVAAGKGWYWVRAPHPRFSQGSKSRDQMNPWVQAGVLLGDGWLVGRRRGSVGWKRFHVGRFGSGPGAKDKG